MAKSQAERRERRRARVAEERRPVESGQDWVVPGLAAAFLLSGAAGLIHEVVWARLLSLVFGATALAISTVLAAYMGGLALGSWWIGQRTERLADGRRTYALLELAIGASAIAVPLLLALVQPFYGWVWRLTHASFATFSVLRLLLAGAILVGPTFMMGATLPVLAHYFAGRQGRRVAPQWLYTVNLLGAVLGVAVAGFVLMPALGVWGTILTGAAINVGVGLAVLALPRPVEHAARRPALAPAAPPPPRPHLLVWLAAFFSGLLSMTTQVAWTRVLSLIVGSTTYAFSCVLIVYLVALGVGSAFASRRGARLRHVGPDLAVAHALFAVLMLVTLYAVNRLPYWYLQLAATWPPTTLTGVVFLQLSILCSVLIVPVLCAGTVLPLAIVAAAPAGTPGTGAAVGRIYAINTLGAIVGALGGGFVLVPWIGSEATLLGVCLVSASLACAFAFWAGRPGWLVPAAIGALAVVGLGLLVRPRWDFNELQSGVFEPGRITWTPGVSLTQEGEEVLYQREGPTATVLVGQRPSGYRNLVINARVNASDSPTDMGTQVLCAQLPLLLGHRTEDVFILGWGSGVTVGSALLWPQTRVTAVEIEPAVTESSRFFAHVNNRPWEHPDRLRLLADDARHILLADETTYDVIISEPSHPWVSGVANLFTEEYYRIAERRLRPDGVFVQWLQTYQISIDSFRSIIAAVHAVFPDVLVFRPRNNFDTLLIATREPLAIDLDDLHRRWSTKPIRYDLGRVGLKHPEDLLANLYLGSEVVAALARSKGVVANTDDNMYVELRGPREYVQPNATANTIVALLKRVATPIEKLLVDPDALLERHRRLAAYVTALETEGRPNERYAERLQAPK